MANGPHVELQGCICHSGDGKWKFSTEDVGQIEIAFGAARGDAVHDRDALLRREHGRPRAEVECLVLMIFFMNVIERPEIKLKII